jgi:hypothetical protein
MAEQPKKPQRSKGKKITLNPAKSWKSIVESVEKREVPIDILQAIDVLLVDGTVISIDIRKLIDDDGMDPAEIEAMLDDKFNELDRYIQNVDFMVDIAKVVNTVQPETDKVLKDL